MIVAPDTGLLLAVGYGEDIDPKAPAAISALHDVENRKVPILMLESVRKELDSKLSEISEVIPALQAAFATLPPDEPVGDLSLIESLMVRAKAASPPRVSRYLDAIEGQVVEICRANPHVQGSFILSSVLGAAVTLLEVVRARIEGLRLEVYNPTGRAAGTSVSVPGITGNDLTHIRGCEQLAIERNVRVVFLVFESSLHAHQHAIASAYPHVVVTVPHYLSSYL